jgi:hypothetical protein
MKKLSLVLIGTLCLLHTGQAHAGWGARLGDLLTNLPFVDVIGEKILENRVVYVNLDWQTISSNQLQVRRDLNSVANVRQSPGTGPEDKVVAQLRPGAAVVVLSELRNKPWLQIRLSSGEIAYIHKSLVSYSSATPEVDDEISSQTDKRNDLVASKRRVARDGVRNEEDLHQNKRDPSKSKALALRTCNNKLLGKGTEYYLNLAIKMDLHSASTYSIHEEVAADIKIDLLTGANGVSKDRERFVAEKIENVCRKYNS